MPRDSAPFLAVPGGEPTLPPPRPIWFWLLFATLAGLLLYLLTRTSFLLFHLLIELSSVVLAAAVFTIGWNARHIAQSPLLLILATGLAATGAIDLLHTLTYRGMGVFPVAGGNLATQFWVAARGLEASAFLLATLHLGRPLRLSAWFWLSAFAGTAAVLILSIWPLQLFPDCYVEGEGLTAFKVVGEFTIIAVLASAAAVLWRRREHLGRRLGRLLFTALLFKIASEFSFTLYADPYAAANVGGHLLKLTAVVLIYQALVEGMLRSPYGNLFRELTALNRNLDAELRRREASESRLGAANQEFVTLYHAAQALHSTLRLDALTHLILSMLVAPQGGGFHRAMLFTVNPRTAVLQGMLGVDRQGASLILPAAETGSESWGAPRLDAAACSAQRETPCSLAVVKQRLTLDAAANALAQACLEGRLVLVENPRGEPEEGRRLAEELALDTYACAPLSGREAPFGVLLVDLAGSVQSPAERLRFLELFSRQASAALENARLLHRLEGAHRELREVQEQLIQGEKLAVLGEMAAQLAHELKNPLVSVGGFANRMVKLELADERAREYAGIIAREVRRLEEMLGNVLAFSKKQLVCLEACDLNALLAESLELEAESRQSVGITLEMEIVAPLPELVGDCRQLRQVVLNLLANARQAMPRGGTLTLRADRCTLRGEDAVSIEVEDTGGGIPSEIMRNIFNPFFSTHPKGTGIGLSISHRIVEQHHGEIEVLNGEAGARFIVRLPLQPPRHTIR